jgi:predicted anti-sigma-YlaC factor YlaD
MDPTDIDLEQEMRREFAGLSMPRAPRSLLPRVLAAVDRPWYARAWLTWPRSAQAVSAAAFIVLLGSVAWVGSAAEGLGTASTLVRIGWRLLQPAVVYLVVAAVALPLALGASWAALTRVAFGGTSQ